MFFLHICTSFAMKKVIMSLHDNIDNYGIIVNKNNIINIPGTPKVSKKYYFQIHTKQHVTKYILLFGNCVKIISKIFLRKTILLYYTNDVFISLQHM